MPLTWREGVPDDEHRLKEFRCARRQRGRGGRVIFPYSYERKVQSAVRTVTPTCDARSAILVGEDVHGIAAIVSVGTDQLGDPGDYFIEMIAVEDRARRQGIGDEALEEAFQWVFAHADTAGTLDGAVLADFDPRNHRARELLSRNGFIPLTIEREREVWVAEFTLSRV